MDIIKFSANNSSNIVFCIVDTIERYPNNWTKEIVKNNCDFEIWKKISYGFDVLVGFTADDLLQEAAKKYDYAVIASAGTVWADDSTFYNLIKEFCSANDFFIMGHILDKKEAYYELHDQCYVVNLKYYKDLGFPIVGKSSLGESHTQIAPLRSEENFHDDYTPKWVKSGNNEIEFRHKLHGWNILKTAFENNLNVIPFNESFRNSKRYLYPDNANEITERLSEFYLENNVASRNWFNPFSTFKGDLNYGPRLQGPLKTLVMPAMGLDFVHYLVHHGYDESTCVRFTDYNLLSLEFMKEMVNWDGNDYVSFLYDFSKSKSVFLELPDNVWLGIKDGLLEKWNNLQNRYNWDILWKDIIDKVTFEFRYKDFLHYEGPFGKDLNYWIDEGLNDPCTLVNLNHVFNYHSTSVFYTLRYRVEMENYTLNKMKEIIPEAHVFFHHRSWSGFRLYNENSLCGQVKNIETVKISELTRPTWHYNNDWND